MTEPDVDALGAAARAQARDAAEALGLAVSPAHDVGDARELLATFNRIWDVAHESDVMDLGSVVALTHSGNYVGLAHLAGRLIGGGVGFCGPPGAGFHSHVVGVDPAAGGKGVGRAIKLDQRAWCLERGITAMRWTYDPLVSRNAAFNIRKLGAVPESYHEDFYGPMNDAINSGQPSDRMVLRWDLTRDLPAGTGDRAPLPGEPADGIPAVVAVASGDGEPGDFIAPPADHTGEVLIGVPPDIEGLRRRDRDLAARWRMVTREAFGALIGHGWQVTDFRPGHYVLRRDGTPMSREGTP